MDLETEIPAPTPSTTLGNTQTHHSDMEEVEIQTLTKEDKIAHLVKIHPANYQKFVEAQKTKATQDVMMALLGQAQKSQKELQKLISKKEVEEYVKGWNPWEEKKVLFHQSNKKHKGKKLSTLSMNNRHYKNPQKWKKLANINSTLTKFYNSTPWLLVCFLYSKQHPKVHKGFFTLLFHLLYKQRTFFHGVIG